MSAPATLTSVQRPSGPSLTVVTGDGKRATMVTPEAPSATTRWLAGSPASAIDADSSSHAAGRSGRADKRSGVRRDMLDSYPRPRYPVATRSEAGARPLRRTGPRRGYRAAYRKK